MSSEPYGGSYDFSNLQSLNRYSYVLNDPESLTYLPGLQENAACGADDGSCINVSSGGGNNRGVTVNPCDCFPSLYRDISSTTLTATQAGA